jgi:catechol-2,3-dioxygenase
MEMELTIQTVLLNVTDLDQSVAFYRDVFDLRIVSQADQVAALMVYERGRRQVLLLRELGENAYHGGRRYIGLRMLSFEVETPDQLDVIEQRLVRREALVRHQRTDTYSAILGFDPDRIEVAVASSLTGTPIRSEDWQRLDDLIYAVD